MKNSVEFVQELNQMKDEKSALFPRKCTIRCALSKDADGTWKPRQLSQDLQNIIQRHPAQFN